MDASDFERRLAAVVAEMQVLRAEVQALRAEVEEPEVEVSGPGPVMEVMGGAGVQVDGSGGRVRVSVDAPPRLFDLKLRTEELSTSLYVFLPAPSVFSLRRNGYIAATGETYVVGAGWVMLQGAIEGEVTYYVTVLFGEVEYAGGPNITWDIDVSTTEPTAGLGDHTAARSPVTIGMVVNGRVEQLHRGQLSTYYTMVDSDSGAFFSLQYKPGNRAAQLYQFSDLNNNVEIDLGASNPGQKLPANIDLVLRVEEDQNVFVRYCALSMLMDYIQSEYEDGGWYDPNPDPYGLTDLPDGHWLYDSEIDAWTEASDLYDDRYWRLGGNQTNCYGVAIGKADKAVVISLDGCLLQGGNWAIKDAVGKNALTSSDRALWDKAEDKAVDWDKRQLSDGADVTVDWTFDVESGTACSLINPDKGWASLNWRLQQLFSTQSAGGAVLALDWSGRTLHADASSVSLSWGNRWLYGDWEVRAGGSLDTPKLMVSGVEYAPTVLNYKDHDGDNQTMTVLAAVTP